MTRGTGEGSFKVGQLARRTGVTVRALHHYERIGLLRPSRHTPAGHRLYGPDDLRRLQQIVSLRRLGFPLARVRAMLDDDDCSLARVLELHVRSLRESLAQQQELCMRLERVLSALRASQEISVDELVHCIEATAMSTHFTPEQMKRLEARRRQIGEERLAQVHQEWNEVFADYRAAMAGGLDPASPGVQAIARRAQGLIDEFTGRAPDLEQSLGAMYRTEGRTLLQRHGCAADAELWQYMAQARRAMEARG